MLNRIACWLSLVLLTGALLATPAVYAQITWYVDDDAPADPGPGDPSVSDPLEDGSTDHPFDAIQEGINAAVDGDTVLVADGTYTGMGNKNLDYGARMITVRSEHGANVCVIDCEGMGRGFMFHSGESRAAVVEGLTIQGGNVRPGAERGGGVCCESNSSPTVVDCAIIDNWAFIGGGVFSHNSSPMFTNCTITANATQRHGAGAYFYGESPVIADCLITGNAADGMGGGVYCGGGSLCIVNCVIADNSAVGLYPNGGGVYLADGTPTLTNCVLVGNRAGRGGGVLCYENSDPVIANCTIERNQASYVGGGIYGQYSCTGLRIANCVVWNNTPQQLVLDYGYPEVRYNDVQGGWSGNGNIDADPLFLDPDGPDGDPNTWEDNDYHLSVGSPCIDAADNTAVPADLADLDDDGDTDEPTPFDLDGNPRFVDDPATDDTGNGTPPIVDMGAYEFQAGIVAYLDIKPGSCPNSLNLHGHGVLPAAIVGTAEFDVTQIDVDTLALTRADGVGGGVTPLMGPPGPGIHVEDVATPFDGEPCECHEYEGDGIDDLTIKFDNEIVVTELQLTELPGGTTVELAVSGHLLDGTQFGGTDCITIRPVGPQPGARLGAPEHDEDTAEAAPETTGTEQREAEQEAFTTPSVACGFLSPVFLPVAIAGMSLARCRRWPFRQTG